MKGRGKARQKIKSSQLPNAEESCLELKALGESSISLSFDHSKAKEMLEGASSNENQNPNIWSEQGPLTAERNEEKNADYESMQELQLSKRSKSPARNDYLRIISRGSSMTSDGMKESAFVKETEIKIEIAEGVIGKETTRKIIGRTIQSKSQQGKNLGVTQVMGILQRNGLIGGSIEANFAQRDYDGLTPFVPITSKSNKLYQHSFSIPFARRSERKEKTYKFIVPYSECSPLYILNAQEAESQLDQLLLQNMKHTVKTANRVMSPLKGRAQKLFSYFLFLIFIGLALTGLLGFILGYFVNEAAAVLAALVFLSFALVGAVLVKWRSVRLYRDAHICLSFFLQSENQRFYFSVGYRVRPGFLAKWISLEKMPSK